MLKTALFDCAISEKCGSVDGGMGICRLFSSPPGGFDSSRVPTPRNLPSTEKKNANARGSARGGGGGALGADGIDGCINITLIFMSSSSEEFRN